MINSNNSKQRFSNKLNSLLRLNKFTEAREILLKEYKKYPDEYFLLTMLSQVCNRLNDYPNALYYSYRAISLDNEDILVIYNHIVSLVNNEKYEEGLKWSCNILEKSLNQISNNGEGIRWAKSIRNDTLYFHAICLYHSNQKKDAIASLIQLLRQRKSGIYSDLSKSQILDTLEKYVSEI